MRALLGILLALNGVAIWGITAVVTLMTGLGLATSPDAWEEFPLIMKLVALPSIIILLGIGHLMIIFGVVLDGRSRFVVPEENQALWFTCNILRQVAIVLILPAAMGLAIQCFSRNADSIPAGVIAGVATALLASLIYYLTRILDRLP